jgi:HK97 family phage prohead protease
MSEIRKFFDIAKVDEEQRMVYGYASTEALDSQGEVIKREAVSDALDEYMQFANIREMHQPSAVGVAKQAKMDDKGLYIAAKVVDETAWQKVKEGVYKGFSIGGTVVRRDRVNKNVVVEMKLSEISLVDRPANPEAVFEVFKSHGAVSAIDALADLLNKGSVSPERLLALAKRAQGKEDEKLEECDAPEEAAEDEEAPRKPKAKDADKGKEKPRADQEDAGDEEAEAAEGEEDDKVEEAEGMQPAALDDEARASLAEFAQAMRDGLALLQTLGLNPDEADQGAVDSDGDADDAEAEDADALPGAEDDPERKEEMEGGKKAARTGSLAKRGRLAKAAVLERRLSKMVAERNALQKRIAELEAQPMPGKALLKAVAIGKSADRIEAENAAEPVRKNDGSIDHEATALELIKKAHQSGGVQIG